MSKRQFRWVSVLIPVFFSSVAILWGVIVTFILQRSIDLIGAHGAVAIATEMQNSDPVGVVTARIQQETNWIHIVWNVVWASVSFVWLLYFVIVWRVYTVAKNVGTMLGILIVGLLLLTACGGYGETRIRQVTIGASETAFIVDASLPSDQTQLQSTPFVQSKAILVGQVPIKYEKYKSANPSCTGPGCGGSYSWKTDNYVYILDRAPVTREWTSTANTGTTDSNQAFQLKSLDDIAYAVEMNCTGQVQEKDAATFLSIYGGTDRKPIHAGDDFKGMPDAVFSVGAIGSVMDRNVRGELQGRLSAAFGPLKIADARSQFGTIITKTVSDVTQDFAKNGLTLLNCGAVGGFQYLDPKVQDSANQVAVAQQQAQAQAITNQKNIDQATADAKAKKAGYDVELQYVQSLATELRDNPQVAQYIAANKWDGKAPQTVVGQGSTAPFINIGGGASGK